MATGTVDRPLNDWPIDTILNLIHPFQGEVTNTLPPLSKAMDCLKQIDAGMRLARVQPAGVGADFDSCWKPCQHAIYSLKSEVIMDYIPVYQPSLSGNEKRSLVSG